MCRCHGQNIGIRRKVVRCSDTFYVECVCVLYGVHTVCSINVFCENSKNKSNETKARCTAANSDRGLIQSLWECVGRFDAKHKALETCVWLILYSIQHT